MKLSQLRHNIFRKLALSCVRHNFVITF